jgi:predicted Rossmann fold flavoprotein
MNEPPNDLPVVVVGAGAAGMLAAIFAAAGTRRVILLERTRDGGRKILISGGGRCNILPSEMSPARYVTDSSSATLRNMLRSWPLAEQIRFFESEVGIPLALEPETGKLFPRSNRARDVRDGLLDLARGRGVDVRFGVTVRDAVPAAGTWRVTLDDGAIEASAVILAAGGLSVPNTGSDGTGLAIARTLGHTINPTYPALTPLTDDPPRYAALAGISPVVTLEVPAASGARKKFVTTGGFLFTHRGYSGPTVLDVSHLAIRSRMNGGPPQEIFVRWTPLGPAEWETLLGAGGTGTVANVVRRQLPERLADALLADAGVDDMRTLAQLRRDERQRLITALTHHALPWTGDEGYRKAEVTGGGVALGEIDPRTMESRRCAGLFLCGEMLDAFGPIGGYNFLWAWATGRAAGMGVRG